MARILALVPDLMLGSRVQGALGAAGHSVALAATPEDADLADADLIVADLNEVDPEDVAAAGPPVLGFYSHVDIETKRRADAAGIALAVPRSRMAREAPELAKRLLGG